MKLKSITIKNFKGIDEEGVTIDFAPITLLFGPNNAGKSTIIQALHLAREVFCEPKPDLNHMEKYGKGFNLGSFKDYVHKHEMNRTICLKLDFIDTIAEIGPTEIGKFIDWHEKEANQLDSLISDIDAFALELLIKWDFHLKGPVLSSYRIYFNNHHFITLDFNLHKETRETYINCTTCSIESFINQNSWKEIRDIQNSNNLEYQEALNDKLENVIYSNIPSLLLDFMNIDYFIQKEGGTIEIDRYYYTLAFNLHKTLFLDWGKYINFDFRVPSELISEFEEYRKNKAHLVNEIFSRFISITGRLAGEFLNKLLYIGPIREIPERSIQLPQKISHQRWATGLAAWDYLLMSNKHQREDFNYKLEKLTLEYSVKIQEKFDITEIERNFSSSSGSFGNYLSDIIQPILLENGITKEKAEIGQIILNEKIKNADYAQIVPSFFNSLEEGENLHDTIACIINDFITKDNKVAAEYNKIINILDEAKQTDTIADYLKSLIPITDKQLYLKNNKTGILTEPHDMGLGVSQIVPFIAAMEFAQKNAFIAIEQPELHIHPKLQVNLGDVVIESALQSENHPLFLIETHSEHLLLRLLRRIRNTSEGTAPDNLKLTPEDIAVNWIGPTSPDDFESESTRQTYAMRLELDADGSFNMPWPEGFFDERGEEIFG